MLILFKDADSCRRYATFFMPPCFRFAYVYAAAAMPPAADFFHIDVFRQPAAIRGAMPNMLSIILCACRAT